MSDRVLLMAIFNAICGLAKRVTGEDLVVTFVEDGRTINLRGDNVSWSASYDHCKQMENDPVVDHSRSRDPDGQEAGVRY